MSPGPEVLIYPNPTELARSAARAFVAIAAESIEARGRFTVALAGGSTPKTTYEILARDHADEIDWQNVHAFFGDERTVPPDDGDSNYHMANEALLSHVPVGSVHRMRGELDPAEAARDYEAELKTFFGDGVPVFDLIQLGIGEDGHTASLFPETPALDVLDRLTVENPVEKLDTVRITLTRPVLNAAHQVRFMVAGEGKVAALQEILEGDGDPRNYPAKYVRPDEGPIWMLDEAAASGLSR